MVGLLQPGTFDLVGTIVYEIDQLPYQNTFYNGTIEVIEAGGLVSVETVFLVSLGISLLIFLGLWVRGQIQNLSKVYILIYIYTYIYMHTHLKNLMINIINLVIYIRECIKYFIFWYLRYDILNI